MSTMRASNARAICASFSFVGNISLILALTCFPWGACLAVRSSASPSTPFHELLLRLLKKYIDVVEYSEEQLATFNEFDSGWIASSEMQTLSILIVHPDTHTPALLSIFTTCEVVPEILKNRPSKRRSTLVALLCTKASMLIVRIMAC